VNSASVSGISFVVWGQDRRNQSLKKGEWNDFSLLKSKRGGEFMKYKLLLSMFAVSTLLLVPAIGSSSEDKDTEVRTLTGCLTKAEGSHEYKLTTENGGTWELHSKSVRLSPHRGHTVTVTGKVRHADMHEAKEKVKDEMKEHDMDKGATEHGHLTVTSLSMVSDSCKR
jgi:Protein of unknown function (DUF5818)